VRTCVHTQPTQDIRFEGKNFIVSVKPREVILKMTTSSFRCLSKKHARALWRSAVQRHTFFRRRRQPAVPKPSPLKRVFSSTPQDSLHRARLHNRTESEVAQEARRMSLPNSQDRFQRSGTARRSNPRARVGSLSAANKWVCVPPSPLTGPPNSIQSNHFVIRLPARPPISKLLVPPIVRLIVYDT